jgi:hypothetical protein
MSTSLRNRLAQPSSHLALEAKVLLAASMGQAQTAKPKVSARGTATQSLKIAGDQYEFTTLDKQTFNGQKGDDWQKDWSLDGGKFGDNDVTVTGGKLKLTDLDNDGGRRITLWYKKKLPKNYLVRYQVTAKKGTTDAALIHWSHMSLNGKSPIGKFDGTYKPYKGIDGYFATFTPTHGRLRKNPGFNLIWENTSLNTGNKKSYEVVFAVNDGKVRQYIDGKLQHRANDPKPIDAGWFALRTLNTVGKWDNIEFGEIKSANIKS